MNDARARIVSQIINNNILFFRLYFFAMDTILNLPIEDIIYDKIFTNLDLEDLFNFSRVNASMENLIIYYFKQIKKLDFPKKFNDSTIYKDCFTLLLENCTNIRELNLTNCNWISDSHLESLFLKNGKLEKISIIKCGQNTLRPLLKCKNLIYLHIKQCKVKNQEFFEILDSLNENNEEFISDILSFG